MEADRPRRRPLDDAPPDDRLEARADRGDRDERFDDEDRRDRRDWDDEPGAPDAEPKAGDDAAGDEEGDIGLLDVSSLLDERHLDRRHDEKFSEERRQDRLRVGRGRHHRQDRGRNRDRHGRGDDSRRSRDNRPGDGAHARDRRPLDRDRDRGDNRDRDRDRDRGEARDRDRDRGEARDRERGEGRGRRRRGGRGRERDERREELSTDPMDVAARRLGIKRLFPEQRRIIDALLQGRDVLVVLPTGFGKSACYQVPSMLLPKPTVVVSPLLALIRDQKSKLDAAGVPCVRIDGTLKVRELREALARVAQGGPLLVMTTPESLGSVGLKKALQVSGVSMVAVDEAHCVSEWGHDFRPSYMRIERELRELAAVVNAPAPEAAPAAPIEELDKIAEKEAAPESAAPIVDEVIPDEIEPVEAAPVDPASAEGVPADMLPAVTAPMEPLAVESPDAAAPAEPPPAVPGRPPILAMTATATTPVRQDIIRALNLSQSLERVEGSPHRKNLAFGMLKARAEGKARPLLKLVKRLRRPGLVYCATTRSVDAVYVVLRKLRIPMHRYHGKMNRDDREREQTLFMKPGRRTVLVGTSAFGMGIDKPDIRYVIHWEAPSSLEQYVQEAGRAGRDGRMSNCMLLYDPDDRNIHVALLNQSRVKPEHVLRFAKIFAEWVKEHKAPTLSSLALSAAMGKRISDAVLSAFLQAGMVSLDENKTIHLSIPVEELVPKARDLARRFETLRVQDNRRLDALAEYANTEKCRAVFLSEYFGETGQEPCGMCDNCKVQGARSADSPSGEPRQRNTGQRDSDGGEGGERGGSGGRRRRRGRRR